LRFVVPAPVVGFAPVTETLTGASGMLLPSASVRCTVTVCGVPSGLVADAGDRESVKFTGVTPGTQFTEGFGTNPTARLSRKTAESSRWSPWSKIEKERE